MLNSTSSISCGAGVGVGDLQHAAISESRRIMREAHGDRLVACQMLMSKLASLELITADEAGVLSKVTALGFEATAGRLDAESAYLQVRGIFDEMLASGRATPVALAIASAATGSYLGVEETNGSTSVVFKKSGGNWQDTLTGVGAAIGGIIGGASGAGLGAVIGGAAGKVVDECID